MEMENPKTVVAWMSFVAAVLTALIVYLKFEQEALKSENDYLQTRLTTYAAEEAKNNDLGRFVLTLMDQINIDYSNAKKQIMVQTIVRVTNSIFKTEEEKQNFAVLLAIESRFNRTAKSKSGAVGVAQIMPQFAREFARACGIGDYARSDLYDLELNMTIGACQFKALLESKKIDGNIAAALVAYNAGKHSRSLRELVGLKNITNREPSSYVAKFTYLSEEAKKIASEAQAKAVKSQNGNGTPKKKIGKAVINGRKK